MVCKVLFVFTMSLSVKLEQKTIMSVLVFTAILHCPQVMVSVGSDWLVMKTFCLPVAIGDVNAVQSTNATDVSLFLCIRIFSRFVFYKLTK